MNAQALPIGLLRYEILESSEVSTLNRLIQLSSSSVETFPADLILRDPQSEENLHVTLVEVTLEHDPAGGAIFFNGTLSTGSRINGHVRPTADPITGIVGSANIRF